MHPFAIVEHFDELKDRAPHRASRRLCGTVDELGLERGEEALGDGVVPTLTGTAERLHDTVGTEQLAERS